LHYGNENQLGLQLRYSRGRSNGGGGIRGFKRASPARKPVEAGIIWLDILEISRKGAREYK